MDNSNNLKLRRNFIIPATILLLLVIVAYYPGLSGPFFSDDEAYILENSLVHDGSISGIWKLFTTIGTVEYLPIRDLSYLIDFQLYGENPLGYKATNLILYLLLLIAALFTTKSLFTLFTPKLQMSAPIALLLIIAIYAMHPAHVESVSWIAGRKDILSTIFAFIALGTFCLAIKEGRDNHRYTLLAISLVSLTAGMLSKAAIFPVALLMALIFIADTKSKNHPFDKKLFLLFLALPLVLISALVLLHIKIGTFTGIAINETKIPPEVLTNIPDRFFPILGTLTEILIWPSDLRLIYDVYTNDWLYGIRIALSIFVIITSLFGAWRFIKYGSLIGLAVPAFLLLNIPYLQIFPFDTWSLASERFLILSSFFPIMGLVLLTGKISQKYVLISFLSVWLVFFALTWQRAHQWQDTNQLITKNLDSQSGYPKSALLKILRVDLDHGKYADASKTAESVTSPIFHDPLKTLVTYYQLTRQNSSINQQDIANAAEAMNLMNNSLIAGEEKIDNYADALFYYNLTNELNIIYRDFLKYDPENAGLHYNIALLYLKTGAYRKAKDYFKQALRLPGLNNSLIINTRKYLSLLDK